MNENEHMSRIGQAMASPVRSDLLCVLMEGRAFTNKELASHCGVTPQTATEHLQHLQQTGLTTSLRSGRCVYHQIASEKVASFLEGVSTLTTSASPVVRAPDELREARCCYSHLAGRLGVAFTDTLRRDGRIVGEEAWRLSDKGTAWAKDMGITPAAMKPCLDWTERRMHMSGPFGANLMTWLFDEQILQRSARARGLQVIAPDRLASMGILYD